MSALPYDEMLEAFKAAKRILTLTHVRPDGDAYGSQLAMTLLLRQMGKHVEAWHEEGFLEKFNFLPGGDTIKLPPAQPADFDLVLALDTAAFTRLGAHSDTYRNHGPLINVDHHISNNGYGDINCLDANAPATGEILAEFILHSGLPLTRDIAENLYAAISTDTGSFQYPSTTARTFELSAELVRAGVDLGKISSQLYHNYPKRRILLLRELLQQMRMSCEDRVASFALTSDVAKKLGAIPEDNEGLIDHIRAIDGVVVAIFLEELDDGTVRISMRSKDPTVDACKICQTFDGGGHHLAAGARPKGRLDEIEAAVLKAVCDEICNRN